jgi:hypothetical protein
MMRARTIAMLLLVLATPFARGQSASEEVAGIRQAIERVRDSADRRWEQIPWVPTLLEARKLSAETKLPVFLFTQEGNLRSGRC